MHAGETMHCTPCYKSTQTWIYGVLQLQQKVSQFLDPRYQAQMYKIYVNVASSGVMYNWKYYTAPNILWSANEILLKEQEMQYMQPWATEKDTENILTTSYKIIDQYKTRIMDQQKYIRNKSWVTQK